MGSLNLEELMYQVSGLFLVPVLIIICALFIYSIYIAGEFAAQYFQRRKHTASYLSQITSLEKKALAPLPGYPLHNQFVDNNNKTEIDLKLYALGKLEKARIVTRVAPMLGLVATMVPMGPALKSLADGNVQGISENLVIAFSAVIFGLVTASLTFWVAAVQKRWMVTELNDLLPVLQAKEP